MDAKRVEMSLYQPEQREPEEAWEQRAPEAAQGPEEQQVQMAPLITSPHKGLVRGKTAGSVSNATLIEVCVPGAAVTTTAGVGTGAAGA
jgi:hypothetical protein